jgi:hypothetical protein
LSLGRRYQRIYTLTKPSEIKPSENGTDHEATRPQWFLQEYGGNTRQRPKKQR